MQKKQATTPKAILWEILHYNKLEAEYKNLTPYFQCCKERSYMMRPKALPWKASRMMGQSKFKKKLQRAQSSQNMDRVKTMTIETEDKNQRLNESRRKTNLLCIASLDALQINDHGSVASGDFGVSSLEKLWSTSFASTMLDAGKVTTWQS